MPSLVAKAVKQDSKGNLSKMHQMMTEYSLKLPAYMWFTVFSQLLSRLTHKDKDTFKIIALMTHQILQKYPSQSLWAVFAQLNSVDDNRKGRAKQVVRRFSEDNSVTFQKCQRMIIQLYQMTKIMAQSAGTCGLFETFQFDHSCAPTPMIVPHLKFIQFTNPNPEVVTIERFSNRAVIYPSMQKPKRIVIYGSDGKQYPILCKQDDLRKDSKVLEVSAAMDNLLSHDYDAEKRQLSINRYAVVPFNEHYGLMEWVDGTLTMKSSIESAVESVDRSIPMAEYMNATKHLTDSDEKLQVFREFKTQHPPVLYQWFMSNFPNPISWYTARERFTKSHAVMCMVGYVLGLGDRHMENILIKSEVGDVLHVDFDCMFEKGKLLKVPEVVPFRLTQNIVDAFGIAGVEGPFRKTCEVTLKLIRDNETLLMNNLEGLIFDPLLESSRGKNKPEDVYATIMRKVRGILDKDGLPVSVRGQAEELIQEATSDENLSSMYYGWLPIL